MSVITLTTDLGQKDFYVPSIKGKLLSNLNMDHDIVDITHEVPIFNIHYAAFTLKNCYDDFPKGSIHIISVDAEVSAKTPALLMVYDDHYFICADNGLFSLMFDRLPDTIYEITVDQETDILTFPTKNIFVKVASHIARGGTPEIIGRKTEDYKRYQNFRATTTNISIRGQIIYTDAYGNIITNINERLFREVGRGRKFIIRFKNYEIKHISKTYSEVPDGDKLAIFNSTGHLEIAINRGVVGVGGSAAQLLGLRLNEVVLIEFFDL